MNIDGFVANQDLFTLGIGFDIAGALLLARGLLLRLDEIRVISGSFWDLNPPQIVARVHDRVAGSFGVFSLVVGFVLQLAAYVLLTARQTDPTEFGTKRAVGLALAAAVGFGLPLTLYYMMRNRFVRRWLIELACFKTGTETSPYPYGANLLAYGRAKGWDPLDDESQADYARRVWRVETIREGGPSADHDS